MNRKIHKRHYAILGTFVVLFILISSFFITRGAIPYSSELTYIEHSILGKDAGSVVPASCNSSPPGSHFPGDCTVTCPSGYGTYDPYYDPGATACPAAINGACSATHYGCAAGTPNNGGGDSTQWSWTCDGSYGGSTPWCYETKAPCSLPWGGSIPSGSSVPAYQLPMVNSPTTCGDISETRSCDNGTLSGSYTNQSCIQKSGTITIPASCVIAVHQSTCTVTASWVSANLASPRFYDNNTNTTLSNAANGSQTVWVAWGGTTFKLTDSTLYNYDTKTVSASCVAGTTWNPTSGPGGIGQCEYDAIASLSANPTRVSYNDDSILTWNSTHATTCTPGGAWTNSGALSGSTSTGNLTSNQTYTLQCFGLGSPSPVVSASVISGTIDNPILNKDDTTFQPYPTAITTFTGQYTENGKIVVVGTNTDVCRVTRTIGGVTNTISGPSPLSVNFSAFGTSGGRPLEGVYGSSCSYTDGNGTVWTSLNPFSIAYKPIPPKPIVSLRASPSNISVNSQSVLTWKVTYPNSVQVPTRPACTLTAKPVCPGGTCNESQLLASTTVNNIIKNDKTDANDPNGSRKITSTSINEIIPYYNLVTNDGDTDWEAHGKRTFILNHSMDFMLRCGSGPNESQGVRVLVTSSTEG